MIVLRCAVPELTAAVPKNVSPSKNVTTPGAAEGVTVAVSETALPYVDGFGVGTGASVTTVGVVALVSSPLVLFKACRSLELLRVARLNWSGNIKAVVFTFKVITEEAPAARAPGLVQLAPPLTAEQLQPDPVPEAKLIPAGRVSITVIGPLMAACPIFVTVIV